MKAFRLKDTGALPVPTLIVSEYGTGFERVIPEKPRAEYQKPAQMRASAVCERLGLLDERGRPDYPKLEQLPAVAGFPRPVGSHAKHAFGGVFGGVTEVETTYDTESINRWAELVRSLVDRW